MLLKRNSSGVCVNVGVCQVGVQRGTWLVPAGGWTTAVVGFGPGSLKTEEFVQGQNGDRQTESGVFVVVLCNWCCVGQNSKERLWPV